MPATHSKAVPEKKPETANKLRKWKKKSRYAKTEEQRLKAEQMIRIHTPKEMKEVVPKKKELTEDQLLDQMIRENKKLRKNPEFIKQQEQAELKRQHLDRERQLTREKIKGDAKERQEQEEKEKEKQLEAYKLYKQDEATLNEHMNSHKELLTEFSEKTGVMETLLEKHKGNKKKAKKDYKSQTTEMCRFFEYVICKISKEKEIPYDDAKTLYYDNVCNTMEQNVSKDSLKQLMASL